MSDRVRLNRLSVALAYRRADRQSASNLYVACLFISTTNDDLWTVLVKQLRELLVIHAGRRLRFSSDADIVRLTNARIIIIIQLYQVVDRHVFQRIQVTTESRLRQLTSEAVIRQSSPCPTVYILDVDQVLTVPKVMKTVQARDQITRHRRAGYECLSCIIQEGSPVGTSRLRWKRFVEKVSFESGMKQ